MIFQFQYKIINMMELEDLILENRLQTTSAINTNYESERSYVVVRCYDKPVNNIFQNRLICSIIKELNTVCTLQVSDPHQRNH